MDLPQAPLLLDARRRLYHPRRTRLRLVCRARGTGRGPARDGAQPRPRPRQRAEGQLLGHGAQAPEGEKADEVARDPGRYSARGGGAVARAPSVRAGPIQTVWMFVNSLIPYSESSR